MMSIRAWFNANRYAHWIMLLFWAVLVLWIWWSYNDFIDVRTAHRKPVSIVGITASDTEVMLGDDYHISMIIRKNRDDCENGRAIRHMRNIDDGSFYLIERNDVLQLPTGEQPFTLDISTKPLNVNRHYRLKPGNWIITSRITYDCPDGPDGSPILRDLVFHTPPFAVVAK